jgi:hypothetical protein
VASLPCEDFTFQKGNPEHSSLGHWAACNRLIREDKWEELLLRSVRKFGEICATPPPWLKKEVRALHELFKKHRKKEA